MGNELWHLLTWVTSTPVILWTASGSLVIISSTSPTTRRDDWAAWTIGRTISTTCLDYAHKHKRYLSVSLSGCLSLSLYKSVKLCFLLCWSTWAHQLCERLLDCPHCQPRAWCAGWREPAEWQLPLQFWEVLSAACPTRLRLWHVKEIGVCVKEMF